MAQSGIQNGGKPVAQEIACLLSMPMTTPTLHLYTDSSPNGFKITIALEELALPYTLHHVRIEEGEHLSLIHI